MNGLTRTLVLVLGGTVAATQAHAQSCSTCTQAGATTGCDTGTCRTGVFRSGAGGSVGRDRTYSPTVLEMTGHSNCELFDRCWPQRYSNLAQRGVNRAFAPQVLNGHVLDQTVWNHHFEAGTDRLTPGGIATLQYLSRRRPEPDRTVYLATANDLTYDPACPERYCGAKQELDALRAQAIQKFMAGNNCGRCADFQILVHDPADVTLHTRGVDNSVQQMYLRYRGGLANQAGGSGGAGATGGAAGGTGGSGTGR
jgi:hypothetical protein